MNKAGVVNQRKKYEIEWLKILYELFGNITKRIHTRND